MVTSLCVFATTPTCMDTQFISHIAHSVSQNFYHLQNSRKFKNSGHLARCSIVTSLSIYCVAFFSLDKMQFHKKAKKIHKNNYTMLHSGMSDSLHTISIFSLVSTMKWKIWIQYELESIQNMYGASFLFCSVHVHGTLLFTFPPHLKRFCML